MKGLNPSQLPVILTRREETVTFQRTLTMKVFYFWIHLASASHCCFIQITDAQWMSARERHTGNNPPMQRAVQKRGWRRFEWLKKKKKKNGIIHKLTYNLQYVRRMNLLAEIRPKNCSISWMVSKLKAGVRKQLIPHVKANNVTEKQGPKSS